MSDGFSRNRINPSSTRSTPHGLCNQGDGSETTGIQEPPGDGIYLRLIALTVGRLGEAADAEWDKLDDENVPR